MPTTGRAGPPAVSGLTRIRGAVLIVIGVAIGATMIVGLVDRQTPLVTAVFAWLLALSIAIVVAGVCLATRGVLPRLLGWLLAAMFIGTAATAFLWVSRG